MIAQGPAAAPKRPTSIIASIHELAESPKTFQSTSGKGRLAFLELETYGVRPPVAQVRLGSLTWRGREP